MKLHSALFASLLLQTCLSATLYAQRPGLPNFPTGQGQTPQRSSDQLQDEIPDTVGVHAFMAERPMRQTPFSDSMLHNNIHQYDPARQRDIDYLTTGNTGGAARYFAYEPVFRRELDIGFHQYDIYRTSATALPFYRLQKAFTGLTYHQRGEQADSYLAAQFARNFADGVHLSLDYKRLRQLGRINQYPHQNSRHTAVAGGLWYNHPKGRYDGFFAFAANTNELEDNGGILVEPQSADRRRIVPANATVFLTDPQTRYNSSELAYTQHFRIGGRADSSGMERRAFPVMHRIRYEDNRYKYFDRSPALNTAFFEWFPHLLTDVRGLRHFIRHRKLENTLRISTERAGRHSSDLIEAGLVHTMNWIDQEPQDTAVNSLFLTGRINFSPTKTLRVEGNGHLGILGNAGDYRVTGELEFNLPKTAALRLHFLSQLYSPTLVQHRFYLSHRNVWDNDFSKTLETGLSATLALPPLNLEVTGAYNLLNNFVYFDSTAMPAQTSVPLSILQLRLSQRTRLWKFHLDNTVVLQKASEPVLRLPEVFSKHSLYYEGRWFKVLALRIGLDVRLNTGWQSDYYNPVVGQFHLQDRQLVPFYPATDVFISGRVTTFRIYVKWEDISDLLVQSPAYYYQSAFYAHPFPGLRFGIIWRLAD